MAIRRSLHLQPPEGAVTQSVFNIYIGVLCYEPFLILAAPTPTPLRAALPICQGRWQLFRTPLHHSDALGSSTKVEPAAATSSGGPTSSRTPVAAASPSYSTAPSSSTAPKAAAASPSSSNVSPSQSPSVKANSAVQGTSSAVIGIMGVVCLMSIAIFLVA